MKRKTIAFYKRWSFLLLKETSYENMFHVLPNRYPGGSGIYDVADQANSIQESEQVLGARKILNIPTGQGMMKPKTRGEAEAEITQAVIKFEKEYLGRGPLDARTFFVNDMILIRLRGVLDPGDRKLAESREGQALLKETRRKLLELSIEAFEDIVTQTISCKLLSFHTDISTKTGERIIVLTTDTNLEKLYS